jgi:hypothetical protein
VSVNKELIKVKTFKELCEEMPLPEGISWYRVDNYGETGTGLGIKDGTWWLYGIDEDKLMFAHRPESMGRSFDQQTMHEQSTGDMEADMRLMYAWFLMWMFE